MTEGTRLARTPVCRRYSLPLYITRWASGVTDAAIEGSISRRPLSEDESQSAISISEGLFVYWSQIGRDERDGKERGSLALRPTWYGFVYTTFGLGASHTRLYDGPWARWAGPGLESPRARPMGFRPAAQARGPLGGCAGEREAFRDFQSSKFKVQSSKS